jgi:hypothetical protein
MFLEVGAKFVSTWSKKVMIGQILYISFSLLRSIMNPTCWNEEIGERRKGRKVMKNKEKKNTKLEVKRSYIEYHFFPKLH